MKNTTFKNRKNKNYTIKKRKGGEPVDGKKIKIFLENNKEKLSKKINEINTLKNNLLNNIKTFLEKNKQTLTPRERAKIDNIINQTDELPTCKMPESMFSLNNIVNSLNSVLNGIIRRIFPDEPSKKDVNVRGLVYKNILDTKNDDLNNIVLDVDEKYNHYYSGLKDKINDVDDLFARLTIHSFDKKMKKEHTYSFNKNIKHIEKDNI
jgi:hypothetical protein